MNDTPDHLQPLRDRLASLHAHKQWEANLRGSKQRLECWTTRDGNTYLIQFFGGNGWTVYAQAGHEYDATVLERIK